MRYTVDITYCCQFLMVHYLGTMSTLYRIEEWQSACARFGSVRAQVHSRGSQTDLRCQQSIIPLFLKYHRRECCRPYIVNIRRTEYSLL